MQAPAIAYLSIVPVDIESPARDKMNRHLSGFALSTFFAKENNYNNLYDHFPRANAGVSPMADGSDLDDSVLGTDLVHVAISVYLLHDS